MARPKWDIEGLDKENLHRMYVAEQMSAVRIAAETGHDEATIRRYLRKHHIRLRTHSEIMRGKEYAHRRTPGLTKEVLEKLYNDEWLTTTQIAEKFDCNRSTVLEALKYQSIPLHTSRRRGVDEATLRDLYISKRWSTIRIAGYLSCRTDETIRKALKRYGIPIRTKSEALRNRTIAPEHRAKLVEAGRRLNKGLRGSDHPAWKGGKRLNRQGYVLIRVGGKDVLEHRHVMEQKLGRKLEPWEEVNHIHGIKTDNRPSELEVIPNEHKRRDWLRLHPDWPTG